MKDAVYLNTLIGLNPPVYCEVVKLSLLLGPSKFTFLPYNNDKSKNDNHHHLNN